MPQERRTGTARPGLNSRSDRLLLPAQDGKLVTVKNQGLGHAQGSTTQVDFFAHGQVSVPTPSLGPNASTDLLVDIPPGCFDPDCNFRITVDVDGVVAESNEGNNIADGICLG
jgi:subtilase family serine protease